MPSNPKLEANLVALRDARERAIAQLSDAFANDLIRMEEFERRLTVVHRANSVTDIAQTVSDMNDPAPATALAPAPRSPMVAVEHDAQSVVAVFAGVERRGPWTLPRRLEVFAIMGGVVLDFRESVFLPGTTEIRVVAMMGGVQIIVPPSLSVEVSGTAIMGGFGHVERIPPQLDPDRPVLRVHGLAIMGGVAIETRLPGESDSKTRLRRRYERRALAALAGRDELKRLPGKTGR
jgi:hypothetical protein